MAEPARRASRRLLQAAVAIGGLVPVGAGLAGVVLGPALTGDTASPDLDSHVRYLSGLLLAIGLAYWASIPNIQAHRARFTLLTLLVVTGGLARLAGLLTRPGPTLPMQLALIMELAITPALCLWQHSLADDASTSDADA